MIKFHSFYVNKLHKRNSFPSRMEDIMMYIAEMVNMGYAPSTISSSLSAISFFHKMLSYRDPTSHFVIKKMLVGTNKLYKSEDTRLPITLDILHKLLDSIHNVTESVYYKCLFKSMYSLMFHAFLRIGEVTFSPNNLQLSDVSVSQTGVVITFTKFKHHVGQPIIVKVPPSGSKYCPVNIVIAYIKLRGQNPGPFFSHPSLLPIQSSYFSRIFERSLNWNRLSDHNFKPHSFRIGAATVAAMLGYSDSQIQAMGRWKSTAFKKYIRIKSFQVPL